MERDNYLMVARSSEVQAGQMVSLRLGDLVIVLARWEGQLYAFNQKCPHAAADLSQGELFRGRVECPDHGYLFDLQSGRVVWPEDEVCRLRRYQVKEEGDQVFLSLD